MREWMNKLELTVDSAFRDAIALNLKAIPDYLTARENQVKRDANMERPATVAEKFDSQFVSRFYYLLIMGVFLRMIETEIAAVGETPVLVKALEAATHEFEAEANYLEENMQYSVIPIQKLVQVQLGTALLILLEQ